MSDMRILSVRPHRVKSLLAFFDFTDATLGLDFFDCRLFEGRAGVFVVAPAKRNETHDGTRDRPYWRPHWDTTVNGYGATGQAYMHQLAALAHLAYTRELARLQQATSSPTPSKRGFDF